MEFGSDYHRIKDYPQGKSILLQPGTYKLYAYGRQALEAILDLEKIKRLWVPSYYCHESLGGVKRMGVIIVFYPCTPLSNPDNVIENLRLEDNDALLRINYYGLQSKPLIPKRKYLVIEDHSHSLSGNWVKNSDADWCFASLRKTLPIADGGIIWSPKNRSLPEEPHYSYSSLENSVYRYVAMERKTSFLEGLNIPKDDFLSEYRRTEEKIDNLEISSISELSREIVETIDIDRWNEKKRKNWKILNKSLIPGDYYKIMQPDSYSEIPFSLILYFSDRKIRDKVRNCLISHDVFPAVLWHIPIGNDPASINYGERILSIHCDGRYTPSQISVLADRINFSLSKVAE